MFQGSIVALITPFRDGAIDEKAFQSFVDWQIEQGTHGLVPCGTTGESPTLSHEEHMRVTEMCIEAAGGRVPVIAGTGSNSTAEAIALTQHAEKAGADAALLVMPYYNKPTQDGLAAHFRAIHDATDIPLLIYNIPGRSVVNMSIDTMIKLAQLPNIVGVKDATGDPSRISTMRLLVGSSFCQLSGEDAIALSLMAHGGHGCISVTANAAPQLCAEFQNACLAGDFILAREYQDRLMPLHTALFLETSPGPVKHAVSLLDRCADELRLPLVPVGEKIANQIRIVMRACELLD